MVIQYQVSDLKRSNQTQNFYCTLLYAYIKVKCWPQVFENRVPPYLVLKLVYCHPQKFENYFF